MKANNKPRVRKRQWPTLQEMLDNVERGILDCREDAVPPYNLDEWDIRGLPVPTTESQVSSTSGSERPDAADTEQHDQPRHIRRRR
jgi:hypothetical protein